MAKNRSQEEEIEQQEEDLNVDYEPVNPGAEEKDLGATVLQAEEYFNKHKNTLFAILFAIAAVVAGLYYFYTERQSTKLEAQEALIIPVFDFEKDSLDKALNGSAAGMGFLQIIDEYGGTPAGNLAHYYAGAIYLKQARFQDAIDHLDGFSSDDALLSSRAASLQGDAYLELKQFDQAIKQYNEAIKKEPNRYFTPHYLLKLGIAHELKGDYKAAASAYDQILDEYSKSQEVQDAKKYKEMALGLINNEEDAQKVSGYYTPESVPTPEEREADNQTNERPGLKQKKGVQVSPEQMRRGDTIRMPMGGGN